MKYQLWSQDEYGTGVILGTFTNPEDGVKKARTLVTDANFGNALSSAEQNLAIEAYLVEILKPNGEVDPSLFYASNRPDGEYRFIKSGSSNLEKFSDENKVKIYVGSRFATETKTVADNKTEKVKTETRMYLKDHKGKEISSLTHDLLKAKTIYFIRQITG